MDLEWLEDFLALREVGSFTLAAERRNSSQSAFSRRIHAFNRWSRAS
jgi:DNA-binding transcriptional LysR family regulator